MEAKQPMTQAERELRYELYNRFAVMTVDELKAVTPASALETEYRDSMMESKVKAAADLAARRW